MNTVLTALRNRLKADATLNYLADVHVVVALDPVAFPAELKNPSVVLKDGTIDRDFGSLQSGVRENLTILGGIVVDGYNPQGEYGVIIGDTTHGVRGTAQILNDLVTAFDGNVTSLDNATDCFLTSAGPSNPIFFGAEAGAEQSFWQFCPFTVLVKRRTTTAF
jgi:hypothetical protein